MSFKQGSARQLVLIETANFTLTNSSQLWFGEIRQAIYSTVIIQVLQLTAPGTSASAGGVIFDGSTNVRENFEAISSIAQGGTTSSANNNKTLTYIFGDLQSYVGEASKNLMMAGDDYNPAARAFITAQFPNSWASYDPASLISSSFYCQKTWGNFFCPAFYFNVPSGTYTGTVRVYGVRKT